MRILFLFILLINPICAKANIDQKKLKIIEDFLSDMTSLEADMTMDIISENENTNPEHYLGKIWLDRKLGLLRINYGKNFMVAKNTQNNTVLYYLQNQFSIGNCALICCTRLFMIVAIL